MDWVKHISKSVAKSLIVIIALVIIASIVKGENVLTLIERDDIFIAAIFGAMTTTYFVSVD